MMLTFFRRFVTIAMLALSTLANSANDTSLSALLAKALVHDADFAAARATYQGESESRAVARAGILPSVDIGASSMRDDYYRRDLNRSQGNDYSFDPQSVSLRISQPLFDLGKWATYQEGDVRSLRAEVVFADARQELILRLATAYFNYLLAVDTLDLAHAQQLALAAQLTQVEHLFKSGAAVVTDVEETKARQLVAYAQELAAKNSLELRRKELGKITGAIPPKGATDELVVPILLPPDGTIEAWVETAKTANLKVLAQGLVVEIAGHQLSRTRADYWPSLALIANHQRSSDSNYFTDRERNTLVGVQLSMNLLDGGGTTAKTVQAVAQLERARQEQESLTSDAEIKASQAFLEVVSGVAQITAYQQAVKSGEITLIGMQVGQKAGLRTNTDVLNAQQQLFAARRDLQKERYTYLINRLTLKAAVGDLGDASVEAVDRLVTNK